MFATVLSGAAQFGVGDPAFTAISREKGGEGKVVAALVGRVANWGVAKDKAIQPFTDPKKLNGLRVTSFPSPSTTFTILSSLKKNLNLSKMEIKQLAFGTEQAALERREADIAVMLEPQTSLAESQGFRAVWSLARYYGDFVLTGVTTTDEFIKNDPETVQRFANGLQTALTFSAKNPEAAAIVLERSFPTLQPAIVRSAMKRMVEDRTIPRTAVIDKEVWIKTLEIRKTVGDLKSLEIADACLDSTFAEKATQTQAPRQTEAPVPAHSNELEKKSYQEPTTSQIHAWTRFWPSFGTFTDILTLLSFLLLIATLWEYRRWQWMYNRLTKEERECGPAIVSCFESSQSEEPESMLVEAIIAEKRRTARIATETVQLYAKLGFLEHRGREHYRPTRSWLTNTCLLFNFWPK